MYGLTTGFGKLKNVAIPAADLAQLQENLVVSHCCGVGEPMPLEEVRIAQVLRLNGLVRGHSGVSTALVETLVRLYTKGFVPVVPRKGSVGASGDLAPLAHMAGAYLGHGDAWVGGRRTSAREALRSIGEEPVALEREGRSRADQRHRGHQGDRRVRLGPRRERVQGRRRDRRADDRGAARAA